MPEPTTTTPPTFARSYANVPALPPTRGDGSPATISADTDDATQERVAIELIHRLHAEVEALRRFVVANGARLPPELVQTWQQWVAGYAQLVEAARTDPNAFAQLAFARFGYLQVDLETFRRFFAHYLGARPPASAQAGGDGLSWWAIGGAGLALGAAVVGLIAATR